MKIALLGMGRVGKKVLELATQDERFEVLFVIDNLKEDKDAFSVPLIKTFEIEKILQQKKPEAVIDFSHPLATMEVTPKMLEAGINMVVCTTGFDTDQRKQLKQYGYNSQNAALLLAPNITPGINLLMLFSKIASRVLKDYDIQILDFHFKDKRDCPSGTARKLVRNLEREGKKPAVYGIRAGGIIGIHKVLLAGVLDKLEITHESFSKEIFAKSALNAALLLQNKTGYLEMSGLLNLKEIIKSSLDEDFECFMD